jgi:YVTN family beta-propeller protein
MKIAQLRIRIGLLVMLMLSLTSLSTRLRADTIGTCGGQMITIPFDDADPANIFFCSIASAYFSGLTNGTTATTYSPDAPVLREQMAAFITRTLDQSLKRGSRRAALGQFWTSSEPDSGVGLDAPVNLIKSDGTYVYVANGGGNRVRRSPAYTWPLGAPVTYYNGIESAYGIAVTPSRIYVTGRTNPGKLYRILREDGAVASLEADNLGAGPTGIAYDGSRVWTANAEGNSVSVFNPTTTTTATIPGFNNPFGIVYDGANIWVTNYGGGSGNTLVKLNQSGAIIQTLTVGQGPAFPMYDGTNIWVPNYNSNSISVVRAATGQVLATLTGNGLNLPNDLAFDGQRVVVTNNGGNSLSLWKATDLTPLGVISTSPFINPVCVCSDGQDFWVTLLRINGQGTFIKF